MKNKKMISYIANTGLFIWFFLDMIGVAFNDQVLVTQSWKEDGLFFLIFLVSLLLYIFKEKVGMYILSFWLIMWFIIQFYFHWYYTIFGPWEGKNNYFSNTIKLINTSEIYVPDLYHIVLHILLLFSLISTLSYCRSVKIGNRI